MRGLTQAKLAEKAGMERTDVNKLERGKLPLGPERLARVAAALEVSVLELRPEVEADAAGVLLLDRLAALEAAHDEDQRNFERMLQSVTERLAVLEAALGLQARPGGRPRTEGTAT